MLFNRLNREELFSILVEHYRPGVAFKGQWQRGYAPFMQGEQNPGIIVQMDNKDIYSMQERGAQFNEATVIFTPESK